jgi:hypothetical protein
MKKKLLLALATVLTALAIPASSFAAPVTTIVTGQVTKSGSVPVSGANVTVNCNSVSDTDTTDAGGQYSVTFNPSDCPDGATATAHVTSSDGTGSNSGTIESATLGSSGTTINVGIVDVQVALPEMGTIVGGVAALGAGGAFFVIRRQQQKNVEQA